MFYTFGSQNNLPVSAPHKNDSVSVAKRGVGTQASRICSTLTSECDQLLRTINSTTDSSHLIGTVCKIKYKPQQCIQEGRRIKYFLALGAICWDVLRQFVFCNTRFVCNTRKNNQKQFKILKLIELQNTILNNSSNKQ